MRDVDEDVRDWATFGLGVLGDLDSEEIRDALWQRISDPYRDVREESLVGLAKRKDQRALQVLIAELNQPEVSNAVLEAAAEFLASNRRTEVPATMSLCRNSAFPCDLSTNSWLVGIPYKWICSDLPSTKSTVSRLYVPGQTLIACLRAS
jgi:hypothetical protein